ncbi:hypothetical protein BDR07DRAFT_1380091 [Suillus spraguei]|nr:hypothetical protein BDR07DRAFT_1380091 [Suillus spraguei]
MYLCVVLKLPDWCWGSSIKRGARASTERVNEMAEVLFRYVQQHMKIYDEWRCRREAFKPVLENALNKADTTAIVASYDTTVAALMILFWLRYYIQTFRNVHKRKSTQWLEEIVANFCKKLSDGNPLHPLAYYMLPRVMMYTMAISFQKAPRITYSPICRFRDTDLIVGPSQEMKSDTLMHLVLYQRGRYTADASIWSAIVTMLAALDISSAKDDQGKVISYAHYGSGLVIDFLVSFYPLVTNLNFVASATLRSSLAVFQHGLTFIQTL